MRSGLCQVDDMLSEIESALAGHDPADLADIPAEHIGGFLDRVAALANRLDALRVDTVTAVDQTTAPLYDGLRTATWVANRTHCRKALARADLHHGRTLRRLPHTAAAYRAGRITRDHVAALAALHRGRLAPLLERDEWYLASVAEACTHTEFTDVLARWRDAADPDGPEPATERRSFRLRPTLDGIVEGLLRTDTVTGAELRAILDRAERLEWEADWAEARRLHGDDATEADLRRTHEQRLHDALIGLIRRGATTPGQPARPTINVVITEDRLRDLLDELAGAPVIDHHPIHAADTDDMPRLDDGTPLTTDDLTRLAVRSFIRRIVIDDAGRPVTISSRQRCFTGPLRDAILALSRTCAFPGCDTPAHRCEVDHIEPWRKVQHTHAANGWPLCDHHQKAKEAGFTPHRHPDGTTHWTRPDGTRLE
jgi:hypothetical protein